MKKTIFFFSLVSIFISACTYDKAEVPQPDKDCVNDSTINVVNVAIADYVFTPLSITIVAGDTVKWTNVGPSPHTVTCDGSTGTSLPAGATAFDSGISTPINNGGTYKIAISVSGSYTYKCLYHSNMSGTIIVKPRCH